MRNIGSDFFCNQEKTARQIIFVIMKKGWEIEKTVPRDFFTKFGSHFLQNRGGLHGGGGICFLQFMCS